MHTQTQKQYVHLKLGKIVLNIISHYFPHHDRTNDLKNTVKGCM